MFCGVVMMMFVLMIGVNDVYVNFFVEEEVVVCVMGWMRDGREERGDAREDDGTRFGGRGVGRDAWMLWYVSGVREREDVNDDVYVLFLL